MIRFPQSAIPLAGLAALALAALTPGLAAQTGEPEAKEPPAAPAVSGTAKAVGYRTALDLEATTALEGRVTVSENWSIPMLAGEGLLADNRLDLKLYQSLSPVSVGLGAEAVLTPVAFLQFNAGVLVGSGWPLGDLGNGLGRNVQVAGGAGRIEKETLQRLMYKFRIGGAFQFDLGAVVKDDWAHVVFRSYHELWYRALSGLEAGDSFQYENDKGENRAGWNYYGNYLLGYQAPTFIDTIGFLLETEIRLYTMAGGERWGENRTRYNFGPLVNFEITDNFSLAVLAQWRSQLNYRTGTAALFYQNRVLDDANPLGIVFNRVALSASLRF